jgi:hypothetical protein
MLENKGCGSQASGRIAQSGPHDLCVPGTIGHHIPVYGLFNQVYVKLPCFGDATTDHDFLGGEGIDEGSNAMSE